MKIHVLNRNFDMFTCTSISKVLYIMIPLTLFNYILVCHPKVLFLPVCYEEKKNLQRSVFQSSLIQVTSGAIQDTGSQSNDGSTELDSGRLTEEWGFLSCQRKSCLQIPYHIFLHRRCNDREEARRSWGPADKEEGNRDFWASIQEPYNYIMGSNLIPDSYQVQQHSLS